MRSNNFLAALMAVPLTVLMGCSTPPTAADFMTQHAASKQSETDLARRLAMDWKNGSNMVSRGEKRVSDGESRIEKAEQEKKKGQGDIRRGQREIVEGRKLMHDSKKEFQTAFPHAELR